MKDGVKIWAGMAAGMALVFVDVILAVAVGLPMLWFWIVLAVGLVITFLPFLTLKGDWVRLTEDHIEIRAPMASLDIPYSSITAVDCVEDFQIGLRVMGYGGLRRGSGDFTNKTLGSYTLAGDTRIRNMVVVRYSVKGRERYAAFNLVDEVTTLSAYQSIKVASEAGSLTVDPSQRERAERSHRSRVRALAAVLCVALVLVVVVVAISMTAGHVDVSADEDSVIIDATMVHEDIPYGSITSVELREGMDFGTRVGGLGNSNYLTGNFSNDEFGRYQLAVHRDVDPCVVIHWSGGVTVVNCGDADSTQDLYSAISAHVGTATVGCPYNAPPIYFPCTS